jgi:hypothetical protein
MTRSTASEGSRRDARNPAEVRWPRVGARLEDGELIVRPLETGERSHLARAVRIAEPCDRFTTLQAALENAAETLAESLRKQAKVAIPVRVRLNGA